MKKLSFKHTIYAAYIGYITQAVVNNLAPLLFLIFQDEFEITTERITLLITVNFCIQLAVDFLASQLADKISQRACMVFAHVSSTLGLVGMALFPAILPDAYAGLLLAVVFYAVGGGLIEVLASPLVEACPTENKSAVMSFLHSFYCWGSVAVVLFTTAFLYAFGSEHWRIVVCLWAILPLFNAFYFGVVPFADLNAEHGGMPKRELFRSKVFWLFIVLMFASGASELSMSQWASKFAEEGLGVGKLVGDLAGPCLFSVLMGLARVFYSKFSEKVSLLPFIVGSSVLCIFAYALTALSPFPALSLVGCAICGFSVGIMWPGVYSLAAERMPRGGTAMFAFLALAGDLGCSSGPTLVGMMAGAFGDRLNIGLIFAIAFPVVLALGGLVCAKWTKPKAN